MPWAEDDECHQRLFDALSQLNEERGTLGRMIGALNKDEATIALDRGRTGADHKPGYDVIALTTPVGWLKGGLERLKNANAHKKRLVYEFLERSEAFRTAIYSEPHALPEELLAFFQHRRRLHADLRFSGLTYLHGTYDLFQRSEDDEKLDVSTLTIETIAGVTCFALQPCFDGIAASPDSRKASTKGITFSTSAAGITMIALGPFDLSIFSIVDSISKRDGGAETRFIRGTTELIGKPHSTEPRKFIAESRSLYMAKHDLSSVENASQEVKDWLNLY